MLMQLAWCSTQSTCVLALAAHTGLPPPPQSVCEEYQIFVLQLRKHKILCRSESRNKCHVCVCLCVALAWVWMNSLLHCRFKKALLMVIFSLFTYLPSVSTLSLVLSPLPPLPLSLALFPFISLSLCKGACAYSSHSSDSVCVYGSWIKGPVLC